MQLKQVEDGWLTESNCGRSPGWRIVDAAIEVRRSCARVLPGSVGNKLALVPAAILIFSLVAGLASLLWGSLHAYDEFLARQGGLSLTQYSTVLGDAQFHTVLRRTLVTAAIAPILAVGIGLAYAMALVRVRNRTIRLAMLVAIFVPLLTGDITRTYGILVALGPNGPVTWASEKLGLPEFNLVGTNAAIVFGVMQTLLPVMVVILLPAVLRIDPDHGAAAMTMGARPRAVLLKVLLPQLWTSVAAALATGFALVMAAFADPAILGRGLKSFVSNFLQDRYLTNGNPHEGAAIGILLLLLVSVGSFLIVRTGGRGRRRDPS